MLWRRAVGAELVALLRRGYEPIDQQHADLSRQVLGHYAYYGISGNSRALGRFWHEVKQLWHYWLKRRSRAANEGKRLWKLLEERFRLPPARLVHKTNPQHNGISLAKPRWLILILSEIMKAFLPWVRYGTYIALVLIVLTLRYSPRGIIEVPLSPTPVSAKEQQRADAISEIRLELSYCMGPAEKIIVRRDGSMLMNHQSEEGDWTESSEFYEFARLSSLLASIPYGTLPENCGVMPRWEQLTIITTHSEKKIFGFSDAPPALWAAVEILERQLDLAIYRHRKPNRKLTEPTSELAPSTPEGRKC